jgi:hypothetical protein
VHATIWPQLFMTTTPPQRPEQAVALSGAQQRLL